MSEELLINFTPRETRVALMQQGAVQELHIERIGGRGIVGNIYLGRVARVLPGMQSAFIEIGLARTAFLHISDIFRGRDADAAMPIEKLLAEGQQLLVQVIKDPLGAKGARLTTQVALAGRLLVFLPQDQHVGISQRIGDDAARELLKNRIQALLPADGDGGYIARTVAAEASDAQLAADIGFLNRQWAQLRLRQQDAQAPACLHQDLTLAQRALRDLVSIDTTRIAVDSRETFLNLSAFATEFVPQAAAILEHYVGERPLFELFGVDEEIERALARRVDLKSGGYLIFDQTEAMTTVDVNTGGFVGARKFDETVFKTNLEAAVSIARQLRLRNLGGIIIVDFIDMESSEHRHAVLEEFNKALARDHTRVTVSGFSQLGLVEMTRKRTREALAQVLCEPCPTCGGRGELKTATTVCYEILRELLRYARQFKAREYRVLASQGVIELFEEDESSSVAMLSDFIGATVSLKAESGYSQEQYDIVLL